MEHVLLAHVNFKFDIWGGPILIEEMRFALERERKEELLLFFLLFCLYVSNLDGFIFTISPQREKL